jgi:hypothetical protein
MLHSDGSIKEAVRAELVTHSFLSQASILWRIDPLLSGDSVTAVVAR